MKITVEIITSLLKQADIEGYIQLGAPSDEYDSEAQALALALSDLDDKEITTQNVTAILNEIWKQSFNLGEEDLSLRQSNMQNFANSLITAKK